MEPSNKITSEDIAFLINFTKVYENERSKQPYHINLIDELRANENAHSRILVKLLQHNTNNNDYPILRSFLNYCFDSIDITINKPKITSERHRIDALVYEHNYAVIIENKIHNAIEQKKQVERYIEIIKEKKIKEENIYILYLTRWGYEPSEISLSQEIKEKYGNRFRPLSYSKDILKWLKNLNEELKNNNEEFLKSALLQYIDHLEGMFKIRKIEVPMINKIKTELAKSIKLTDDYSTNIEILDSKSEIISQLQIIIKQLQTENKFKQWTQLMKNDFSEKDPTIEFIEEYKNSERYPRAGIKLMHNSNAYMILIEKSEIHDAYYYGLKKLKKETYNGPKILLNGFTPTDHWHGYKFFDKNFTNNEYSEFREYAKNVIDLVMKHEN